MGLFVEASIRYILAPMCLEIRYARQEHLFHSAPPSNKIGIIYSDTLLYACAMLAFRLGSHVLVRVPSSVVTALLSVGGVYYNSSIRPAITLTRRIVPACAVR